LGATDLLIAGGEPFLRKDMPEVLGDAIIQGLYPGITTKFPLNVSLAERLANAGLRHICLSLDSISPDDNAILIGSRNYLSQVYRTVHNLVGVGLAFSFQCVLTRLNVNALEGVIAEAERLGAQVIQVVPYEPVLHPIGPYQNNHLTLSHDVPLDEVIQRLSEKYSKVKIEKFENIEDRNLDGFHCDVGMTKLLFTANGKVHRCYKLLRDRQLSGLDLNHVSVAEAWHDPGFYTLISPGQTAYSDSACEGCGKFKTCHGSGRCIYQSYVDHQTYYSKDRKCAGPYRVEAS
jgi:radical SAM protein with 4Fe4S-binding SPASM domain